MRIPRDPAFGEQAARFSLRFNCESCALFDEVHERCAHGFPTEEHRAQRYRDDPTADVMFCKEWESV